MSQMNESSMNKWINWYKLVVINLYELTEQIKNKR